MTNFILADEYVTDTVGLIIYLENRQLGIYSQQIFNSAKAEKTTIYVPSMVLAEIMYLSEKKRITATLSEVFKLFQNFPTFKEFSINADVIKSAEQITDIPELHDRLISATAKFLNLELITTDTKIQSSAFVKTVW
jgi:predicted nucleic acid-binding protein